MYECEGGRYILHLILYIRVTLWSVIEDVIMVEIYACDIKSSFLQDFEENVSEFKGNL